MKKLLVTVFVGFLFSTQLPAAFSVDNENVSVGTEVELTWSSQASSCEASGSWSGPKSASGSEKVTVNNEGWNVFTISCAGASEYVFVWGTAATSSTNSNSSTSSSTTSNNSVTLTVSVLADSSGTSVLQIEGANSGYTAGGSATSSKRTVYLYASDGSSTSPTYTGSVWPYVMTSSDATITLATNVTASVSINSDGHVLINNQPAYQYIDDSDSSKLGNANNEVWYAFRLDGNGTNAESSSSSASSSSNTPSVVNSDLYAKGSIVSDSTYSPFNRYIDVNGLRIFSRDEVTNGFIKNVADAYENIVSKSSSVDSSMQEDFIQSMLDNRVHQRLGFLGVTDNLPNDIDAIPEYGNNLTDYIWEEVPGRDQIREVLEHLLHTITNVGFYFYFPNKWNWKNTSSDLYLAMQEAIDKGIYDVSSYEDRRSDSEGYGKVITTEFAYWLILAEWDYFEFADAVQEGYSTGNEEFTLGTSTEIQDNLPLAHKLYEDTASKVLNKPDASLIENLFLNFSSSNDSSVYSSSSSTDASSEISYTLSGTDANYFNIDTSTGKVTFKNAPDYENPVDANNDNIYEIIVTASAGSENLSENITITVTDVTETTSGYGTSGGYGTSSGGGSMTEGSYGGTISGSYGSSSSTSNSFSFTASAPTESYDYSEIEISLTSSSTITEVELISDGSESIGSGLSFVSYENNVVKALTPIVFQDTEIAYELKATDSLDNTFTITKNILVKIYEHPIDFFGKLSTIYTDKFSTEDYEVFNFSFDAIHTAELYTEIDCYQVCREEDGYFGSDLHNGMWGDFNGDGHEDFVATWAVFPSGLERDGTSTLSNIEIYLNNGEGRLIRNRDIYVDGVPPSSHFLYRMAVADFNKDGIDDIFSVAMGLNQRGVDGERIKGLVYPHALLLSTPEGKFRDASSDIEGNTQAPCDPRSAACSLFAGHNSASGDINGDGYPDLSIGHKLYLNENGEKFVDVTDQLPSEWEDQNNYQGPMTTEIQDFNNDGFGDLVVFWADNPGLEDPPDPEILLSNGTATISDWTRKSLPIGYFGDGLTKFNNKFSGDIDGDGDLDMVTNTTRTNPYYYRGRFIQVLINDGNGNFTDNSFEALGEQPRAGDYGDPNYTHFCDAHGEGSIFLRDYDGDGDLDIIDVGPGGASPNGCASPSIFLNNGTGVFSELAVNWAWVQGTQVEGWETWQDSVAASTPSGNMMLKAYPLNLDNKNHLDFVSSWRVPAQSSSATSVDNIIHTYQIMSKKESSYSSTSSSGNSSSISFTSTESFTVAENSNTGFTVSASISGSSTNNSSSTSESSSGSSSSSSSGLISGSNSSGSSSGSGSSSSSSGNSSTYAIPTFDILDEHPDYACTTDFFSKYINVFGVYVMSTSEVPISKMVHTAKVLASYIDNDEDGEPDDSQVLNYLVNKNKITPVWTISTREAFGSSPCFESNFDMNASMYVASGELNTGDSWILGGLENAKEKDGPDNWDTNLEEMWHIVTDGWSGAYESVFGGSWENPSELTEAMDTARGGRFNDIPASYPADAWYTDYGESCSYGCKIVEYIYWGLMSNLNALSIADICSNVESEWKLCTTEEFKATDTKLSALLNDRGFAIPTNIPDGNYRGQKSKTHAYAVGVNKIINESGTHHKFTINYKQSRNLTFVRGNTYYFDLSGNTFGTENDELAEHPPLQLSTTKNGNHGGGLEYLDGVTKFGNNGEEGSYLKIVVSDDAPNELYYYCEEHDGMAGDAVIQVINQDDISSNESSNIDSTSSSASTSTESSSGSESTSSGTSSSTSSSSSGTGSSSGPLNDDPFSADKENVSVGSAVILSWNSTAQSCSAGGAWSGEKSASGSESVTVSTSGWNLFTLTCGSSYEYIYIWGS